MAWKDFRNGMKEKRSGGKRKIITDLNSCFTSLTEKRFQESWEDTNKSSLQKKYTYATQMLKCRLGFSRSYRLSSLFLQPWQRRRRNQGKRYIIKKGVDCSKTKL